jgi:hypothetical protein
MANKDSTAVIRRATQKIEELRTSLQSIDYLCSGSLSTRSMTCGKASCRCHEDPQARHGPYHQWGHMHEGKLVHRYVSAEQAVMLRHAIENFRTVKKLLLSWERESERLIDATYPR